MKVLRNLMDLVFIIVIMGIILLVARRIVIVNTVSYKNYIEDSIEEIQEKREAYSKQIEKDYRYKFNSIEIVYLMKDIDYLNEEYRILTDLIKYSDTAGIFTDSEYNELNTVLVNLNDIDKLKDVSDLKKKILSINSMIDYLNYSEKKGDQGIADKLNLWWYSLGRDRYQYEYVIENINNKTEDINNKLTKIKNYKSLPNITKLNNLYPYNEDYEREDLKEEYQKLIND